MTDNQKELQKALRESQQKYAYYIVALNVSAIAFVTYNTMNRKLDLIQIPFAIAVGCWMYSIYCGLRYLRLYMNILLDNNDLLDMQRGVHPITGAKPSNIEVGVKALTEIMETKSEKHGKLFEYANRYLYRGTFLFIVWQVLQMYNN